MLDIALNLSHDIDTSTLDLKLVNGAERVRQQLLIKLKLWTGEWFLDTEFGTPYLKSVLGKQLTLSGVVAALRKSILEVENVSKIRDFTYQFDNEQRTFNVQFIAETSFGAIEVST